MQDYTTTQLVKDVKRRASVPANQALFTDEDIIDFMDDEMHSNMIPLIMQNREEFFVVTKTTELQTGENTIPIPSRAIGTKLRDVTQKLTSGEVINIARWSPEMIASRARRSYWDRPTAFYLQGNNMILYPAASSSTSINTDYFRRPGHLVPITSAAEITAIDDVNNIISTGGFPSGWVVGDLLDGIQGKPPFTPKIDDMEIISFPTATDIEVDDVGDLIVGDWVAYERESPIPNIPMEGHPILVQMAIIKIYESLGSEKELATAQAKYEESMGHFRTLISDRVEGEPKKLVGGTSIQHYTNGYNRRGWW